MKKMIRGKYQNLFLIFILSMFNFNYKEFNPDVGGFINHEFQVYFLLLLFVPYKFFFFFFYAELFKWKIRSIFRKASKKKNFVRHIRNLPCRSGLLLLENSEARLYRYLTGVRSLRRISYTP